MASKVELRGIAVALAERLGRTVDVATKNHAELTALVESLRADVDALPASDDTVTSTQTGDVATAASSVEPGPAEGLTNSSDGDGGVTAPTLPAPPDDIGTVDAAPPRVARAVTPPAPTTELPPATGSVRNRTGYVVAEGRSITTMNGEARHAGAAIRVKDFYPDTITHLLSTGAIEKAKAKL